MVTYIEKARNVYQKKMKIKKKVRLTRKKKSGSLHGDVKRDKLRFLLNVLWKKGDPLISKRDFCLWLIDSNGCLLFLIITFFLPFFLSGL